MAGRRAITKQFSAETTPLPYTYLVNSYPTNGAGWFPYRIKYEYDKCLQVRRSSDDAIVDVFTDVNPAIKISLNSIITGGVTLGTWAGTDDVYVVKAYDMTGNGRHWDNEPYPLRQPLIISAGILITDPETGEVAMYASGEQELQTNEANPLPISGDVFISFFGIQRQITNQTSLGLSGIMPGEAGTDRRWFIIADEPARTLRYSGGFAQHDSALPNLATIKKTIIKLPNATPKYWESGIERTLTGASAGQNLNIQSASALRMFNTLYTGGATYTSRQSCEGYISGQIWYFEDMTADREGIEALII